jgi:hypothetical protein
VRRIIPLLLLPLLAATACGASLSPAIEVNADEVSRSDLLEQTATLAEPLGLGSSTTVSGDFTRDVIVIRINELVFNQAAADLGIEISDEHLEEAADLVRANNAEQFPDPEILDEVVAMLAPSVAAQLALGESADANQVLLDAYASSDIRVDPRFGTWDGTTGRVDPPPAPVEG